MKTIFECETELGRCDSELVERQAGGYELSNEPWGIFAHTTGALNGTQRMLKIEQRCYLRRGDEFADQSWVRAEMTVEPVLGSVMDAVAAMKVIHEEFIRKAREQLPEQILDLSKSGLSCI